MKHLFPLLSLTVLASTALAEMSPEAVCEQLRGALEREIGVLASVQDAASAESAVPQLESVLNELASMNRSHEAEHALWLYIDNTEGVKLPFIELLDRLAIEFTRLEDAAFYGNARLRSLLEPQVAAPEKTAEEAGSAPAGA